MRVRRPPHLHEQLAFHPLPPLHLGRPEGLVSTEKAVLGRSGSVVQFEEAERRFRRVGHRELPLCHSQSIQGVRVVTGAENEVMW